LLAPQLRFDPPDGGTYASAKKTRAATGYAEQSTGRRCAHQPSHTFRGKRILLFACLLLTGGVLWAQRGSVSGVVTENGRPLSGASVTVKGTTIAVLADVNGAYAISVPEEAVLVFRFVGFRTQEVAVGSRTTLNVELEVESRDLEEVVVSAGGIYRARREQGYSVTKITAKELTVSKPASLSGGLVAKVPGLQVNAVSSGINPNYRLVLRGNRSITGNNQALVVVDNAIVSSDFLNNINPETIADIQVLNGAAGATLYGSEASNGVLLITTKSGEKGKPRIQASHTLTLEQVSFYPKQQSRFGQGKLEDGQVFEPIENQQYGPAFDGSLRDLGYPLENGEQQRVTYEARDDRKKFWETGVQNQTDVSASFGNDRSTAYVAAQYFTATGTTPGDKYNRASVRLNNAYSLLPNLQLSYNAGYVENNYDITTATGAIYDQLLNVPANVPLLSYKDWENGKWADREGWFCPYYDNPYYTAANNRGVTKNTYLSGKVELKWAITPWLSALYRASMSNRYYQAKHSYAKSTLSDYALEVQKKENHSGVVYDSQLNTYRVNHDFQLSADKTIGLFSLNLTVGAANALSSGKETSVEAALLIPGLYNVGNRSADPAVGSAVETSRSYGLWGDLVVGYHKYLFLHLTGRNDWTSLLAPENRSYFYPSTDVSFIPTDAFPALKEPGRLSYWKIRAAASQTGNVNIAPYALEPVYGSSTGWSAGTFFSESGVLVSKDLKPEITLGYELGTELRMFDNRAEVELTYYYSATTDQTILATIASSSGYSGYLLNTGKVTNKGVETALRLNPVRTGEWNLHVGMNYTHNENMLVSLHPDTKRISVNGSSVIFAEEGQAVNQIIVSDYKRDPNGRVIVDINTGYPSPAEETVLAGNTSPKHRLGLDFALQWKNFTVSSLFEYRGGYYCIFAGGWALDFSGASARSAYYNRERFVFPNSSYMDPASGQYVENTNVTVSDGGSGFWVNATYNTDVNSNYVYSGDYWKWRELAVSYNVPQSVLGKLGAAVSAVTLSVQGRNLFLWTPASNEYTDPDLSANGTSNAIGVSNLNSSPPTRYFGGSILLTF
jgi:TonB-linked SusC/RagA family outer membrane protein